jgi:putative glutamine amidotransferase
MTVIGITIGPTECPRVVAASTAAVPSAGGTPVLRPTVLGESHLVDDAIRGVDALLLSGGGDVHPSEYGEATRTTLGAVDRQRDRMELRIVAAILYPQALRAFPRPRVLFSPLRPTRLTGRG